MAGRLFHYADLDGYNVIRSAPAWVFKAAQPPGEHEFGAYFTTLDEKTLHLAMRLGIPRRKIGYVFAFEDIGDLRPARGDRGEYIVYSRQDYVVEKFRQLHYGATGL